VEDDASERSSESQEDIPSESKESETNESSSYRKTKSSRALKRTKENKSPEQNQVEIFRESQVGCTIYQIFPLHCQTRNLTN